MKMIDRFHNLIALVQEYKYRKSPITKYRIHHRKYEILKEFKEKDFYTPEDLCNYGWIINWAKEKWEDNKYLFPDFFIARGVDGFYFFEYKEYMYNNHITITSKNMKSISKIEVNIYNTNREVLRFELDTIELDSSKEMEIIYTCLEYTLSYILNRLVRGD